MNEGRHPGNETARTGGKVLERRSAERVRTAYRTAQISTLTDRGLCLIHNLSDGGAMVETSLDLSLDDSVRLAITEGEVVRGRVAWKHGTNVGIRFLSAIDCCGLLRDSAQERWTGKSRAPRLAIRWRAVLKTPGGALDATVHDISQKGMKTSYSGELLVAQRLEITLEGGLEVKGIVRWVNASTAGIQFSDMLTIGQLGSMKQL